MTGTAWTTPLPIARLVAVVAVIAAASGIAVVLKGLADPLMGGTIYLTAVAAVAAFWGLRDGVLAALLSTVAFTIAPVPPLDVMALETSRGWTALGIYLAAAVTTTLLIELARRRVGERSLQGLLTAAGDPILVADDERCYVNANPSAAALLGLSLDEIRQRRIDDVVGPEVRPALPSVWAQFLEQGTMQGEFEIVRGDGSSRDVEVSATAHFVRGRHLSIMRDVTTRNRMADELRRRARQRAMIAELGVHVLRGQLPPLMDAVVQSLADTLPADAVAILEFRPGLEELVLCAGIGLDETLAAGTSVPVPPGSHIAVTVTADGPVIVEDFAREARVRRPGLLLSHSVSSGATVLIGGRGRSWGMLAIYRRRRFSVEDVSFVEEVATVLGMAIEHYRVAQELRSRSDEVARLASERQRIVADALDAEDRTRQRISERLHDESLQTLLAARQDLAEAVRRGDPHLVERAKDGVHKAIRDLRSAVAELHPVFVEHGGLGAAVRRMVERQAGRTGATIDLRLDVDGDAVGSRDRLVLSTVRELLTNCGRHADARNVRVKLEQHDGEIVVEVADDGRGMPRDRPKQALGDGHLGLASIAQRVEALGGRCEVEAAPGEGTVVRVSVPLEAAPTAA